MFWKRVEDALLYWKSISPARKWFLDREGWWVALRFGLLSALLAITALTTWQSPWGRFWRVAAIAITIFLLFDIMVAHVTIAFLSQRPTNRLRSAVLGVFSFSQIPLAFAVFLLAAASAFEPTLTWHSALYFSVLTATTLGHGGLSSKHQLGAEALIAIEVLLGLAFISVLIARLIGLETRHD